ncbi:MAG: FAD:protein FMN transferase [Lautropia sp.]
MLTPPGLLVTREESLLRARFLAMASPCEVLVDGADDALAVAMARVAADEAWRIERAFSRYRDDNLVHRINTANGSPVQVDAELARLLDFADRCHRLSDGLFDVTAGVLRRAWRFAPGAAPPTRASVAALLRLVGWHKVEWVDDVLRMPAGMEIDLGGIGKEYAVDRALARMLALAPGAAPACLVNFGGDLRANRPPDARGSWRIGVESVAAAGARDGADAGGPLLELECGACTTSGDTHRFVLHRGRRYGHVLDPRTGFPVPDAPRSVTVRGDTCTETGVLSTLAMLHGSEAEAFLDAQQVRHHVQR